MSSSSVVFIVPRSEKYAPFIEIFYQLANNLYPRIINSSTGFTCDSNDFNLLQDFDSILKIKENI